MSFRVTTGMSLNSYRYNLNKVNSQVSDARDTVLTQRNFNSYAADPAAATQAFRLRRAHWQTTTHLNNSEDAYSKFNVAWSSIGSIVSELSNTAANVTSLAAITGTAGAGRVPLGQSLMQSARSVILSMNVQYGDQYVFAGNDALNVPFTWDDQGNLFYRGVNVSCKENSDDYTTLTAMANEVQYVDIGLGMKESSPGEVINGSAFDMSLPGIEFLGYGLDENEDPKNLAVLMYQLGSIFARCDPNSGDYASPVDEENALRLVSKLNLAHEAITEKYVELDTRSQFLTTNTDRLTSQQSSLNEQILNVEQVDLADAITDFSWQQYCYNAALKVGNQLLGQTLIDYMN